MAKDSFVALELCLSGPDPPVKQDFSITDVKKAVFVSVRLSAFLCYFCRSALVMYKHVIILLVWYGAVSV